VVGGAAPFRHFFDRQCDGTFLIGLIQQVGLSTLAIPETVRLVLTIGVMGGF
jgi:fluoride ion exporter CrcB/FEX